jgi:hypothetical protein
MPTVEDRVRALVDDRLFKSFWGGLLTSELATSSCSSMRATKNL